MSAVELYNPLNPIFPSVLPGNKTNANTIYAKEDTLVDCTNSIKYLSKDDKKKVTKIFLTHTHPDHISSLLDFINEDNNDSLLRYSGSERDFYESFSKTKINKLIYTSQVGREYLLDNAKHYREMLIDNYKIMPGLRGSFLANIVAKVTPWFINLKYKPVLKNLSSHIVVVEDGQTVEGLTANIVGGHSKDSIVWTELVDGKNVGYMGDTAYRNLDNISVKTWQDSSFSDSIAALEKIISLDLDVAVLSHSNGETFKIKGKEKIRETYERVKVNAVKQKGAVLGMFNINDELTMKEIRDTLFEQTGLRCYSKESSDFGYGFTYSVIRNEIENGRMINNGKKITLI